MTRTVIKSLRGRKVITFSYGWMPNGGSCKGFAGSRND